MTTANHIGLLVSRERHSKGLGPFPCQKQYTDTISAALRRRGIPHAPAQYDGKGVCLTCGDSGRCPGVHTFEEIQEAARRQKED